MCFNNSWLDVTTENDATGRTNREVQTAVSVVMSELDQANNPLQGIYGTHGFDTRPETNRSPLAVVGWINTSCASGTTRSDI
jgi:hypothetical protein